MNTVVTSNLAARKTWQPTQLGFAVVAVVCIVFANGVFGKFIFDDLQLTDTAKMSAIWEFGSLAKTRPIGSWTFQLNYVLGGLRPWHFHVVNIGIHAAAAAVLFGLVRRTLLLPGIDPGLQQHASQFALAAATIWAVHPLQVQSVTYITQRYESLMGLFYLLVLYCVLRGTQSARSWLWYTAAIVAAWLGAGTKEIIMTAPLVAFLFDATYLSSWRQAFRRGWLYLLLATPILWIVWMLRKTFTEADLTVGFGMKDITPWEYLRSQPAVLLNYLRLAFWPDELILDRGWPVASSPWEIYGLGVVIVALLGLSLWALWRQPKLGFLGLASFLIIAPTSSIVPVKDLAFDHRIYLSLAPIALLLMIAAYAIVTRLLTRVATQQTVLAILTLLVVAPLSLRTIQRNRVYADPVRLMTECIEYNPLHPRPYRIMADILLKNQPKKALEFYSRALELSPDKYWVLIDIGNLHLRQHDYAEALLYYRRAIASRPAEAVGYINASRCLSNLAQYQEAVALMHTAVKHQPTDREAVMQLAWLLSTAEDDAVRSGPEALAMLRDLPLNKKDQLPQLEVLATAYAECGDFDQAIPLAEQAVELARAMNSRRIVEFENRLHLYRNQRPYRAKPRQKTPSARPTEATPAA